MFQAPQTNYIQFIKGNPWILKQKPFTKDEAYNLKIDSNVIKITASTEAGAFYAIQTIRQLSTQSNNGVRGYQTIRQLSTQSNNGVRVPHVDIMDQPRFQYRGMHIDVGRNFVSKSEILRLLDAMALYKLNKFHFHLTDDEGWRIEIPGLEELTKVMTRTFYLFFGSSNLFKLKQNIQ